MVRWYYAIHSSEVVYMLHRIQLKEKKNWSYKNRKHPEDMVSNLFVHKSELCYNIN